MEKKDQKTIEEIKKYFPEVALRIYNYTYFVGINTRKRFVLLGSGNSEEEAYNNAYEFLKIAEKNDPK